ncbi:MAG: hypothetical protein U0790_05410 [Isosphaeraceae bacterium]
MLSNGGFGSASGGFGMNVQAPVGGPGGRGKGYGFSEGRMMRIWERRLGIRGLFAAMAIVLAAGPGCSDLEKDSHRVRPGMTIAEADGILGLGREVAADRLPEVYREIFLRETKGEGVSYREWTEESGQRKTNIHAAFIDGKLIFGPAVWKTGPMSVELNQPAR